MDLGPEPAPRPLISLTPLIDVVFILLVFFMLASSFLDWQAVDLRITGTTASEAAEARALVIRLESDGTLSSGGRPLEPAALSRLVADRLEARPDLEVVLAPAAGVPLQRAVDVLQQVRAAGADNVSLSAGGG